MLISASHIASRQQIAILSYSRFVGYWITTGQVPNISCFESYQATKIYDSQTCSCYLMFSKEPSISEIQFWTHHPINSLESGTVLFQIQDPNHALLELLVWQAGSSELQTETHPIRPMLSCWFHALCLGHFICELLQCLQQILWRNAQLST